MLDFFKHVKDRIQGKAEKGQRRSSRWREVRKKHLARHPRCDLCEGTKKLEVHHVIPFHVAPDLELHPDNLMTLCENKKYGVNCHQLFGHLGNYRRINVTCQSDVAAWNKKIKG